MSEKFKKGGIFILNIILTALASAAIAMLQSWIQSHGVDAGPSINPQNTALIGGGVSTLRTAWKRA